MKLIYKQMIVALMMGFVFPWMILGIVSSFASREESLSATSALETDTFTQPEVSDVPDMILRVVTQDSIESMALEEYVAGVVLVEMPADFEPEALKAQAVVARTYALRRKEQGKSMKLGMSARTQTAARDTARRRNILPVEEEERQWKRFALLLMQLPDKSLLIRVT